MRFHCRIDSTLNRRVVVRLPVSPCAEIAHIHLRLGAERSKNQYDEQ
jgi:hypothetical protein